MFIKYIIPVLALAGLSAFFIPLESKSVANEVPLVSVPSGIHSLGIVEPLGEVSEIHAPQALLIEEVLVKRGEHVEPGTPLFRLRNTLLNEQLLSEKKHLEWLEEKLGELRTETSLAKESYDRVASYADGVVISRDEVKRRKDDYEKLKQSTQSFKKEIAYKSRSLDEIRAKASELTVVSRTSGQVVFEDIKVGEMSRTQGVPHFKIGSAERAIRIEVNEKDAWRIKTGQRAYLTVPGAEKEVVATYLFSELEMRAKSATNGIQNVPDSRVLPVVFRIDEAAPVFIGQQLEVRIEE